MAVKLLKNTIAALSVAVMSLSVVAVNAEAGLIGTVAQRAGSRSYGWKDGSFKEAEFFNPYSAVYTELRIFVTDSGNHCIREIDPISKKVSTYTGHQYKGMNSSELQGYKDGAVAVAKFNSPRGIAADAEGSLYVADSGNNAIRKIKDGRVRTLAGSGKAKLTDGYERQAAFNKPTDVAVMGDSLYVADSLNRAIRVINKNGEVSTLVKGGKLIEPTGLYVDGDVLYIVDAGAQAVFSCSLDGQLKLLAGGKTEIDKTTGYRQWGNKNGDVSKAQLSFPKSVAAADGSIYIADTYNSAVKELSGKKLSTVVTLGGAKLSAKPTKLLPLKDSLLVIDNANNQLIFYKR